MEGVPHPVPRTVEEVFTDFKGRRSGLIKALTTGTLSLLFFFTFIHYSYHNIFSLHSLLLADVEKFYQQCDPGGFRFSSIIALFSAFVPIIRLLFRYFYYAPQLSMLLPFSTVTPHLEYHSTLQSTHLSRARSSINV